MADNSHCPEDDLPEDFFDEFANADFLNGLNVVDKWDGGRPHDLEDDLRDLIRNRKHESARDNKDVSKIESRRDVSKTNRDIKRDKETKVKDRLKKSIDSASAPPGTELDDLSMELANNKRRHSPSPKKKKSSPERKRNASPKRYRASPERKRSPRRRTPQRRRSRSPVRRRSPIKLTSNRLSPLEFRRRRSRTRTPSPLRDRRQRLSRSRRHSRSRSRSRGRRPVENQYPRDAHYPPQESFQPFPQGQLYPQGYPSHPEGYYPSMPGPGAPHMGMHRPGIAAAGMQQPGFYPEQDYSYPGNQMGAPAPQFYNQPGQLVPPPLNPAPQPVPAPVMAPVAVLPPERTPDSLQLAGVSKPPAGSLDQLLEDGKISKEDYLKLKPKNRSAGTLDISQKVKVLSRCHDAINKLSKLHLPNRLIMNNSYKIPEIKSIASKYCSPLKRQPLIVFNFTSAKSSTVQANKQLVDSIIATIGLQDIVKKPVKKDTSKLKDASVQTTTPFCESCEIRLLTKTNEKGSSIDSDHFSTSVHTQVIEAELASSKTTFTPVGNMSDSAPMSLSHLTPAQLIVSQLAARAKKLEQPPADGEGENYSRRANASNSYYGGQSYHDIYRY